MKLLSITQTLVDARKTFARFPLAILVAIFGTTCTILLIDSQAASEPTVLIQLIFGAILGFPLLTGLALISEKWKWSRSVTLGVQFTGIILVGLYVLTVPQNLHNAPSIHLIRLFLLTLGLVLFNLSAPFYKYENELEYWNFCKILYQRVFTTGLYAIVLSGGLAIALAALNYLFDIDIPGKRYAELIVLVNGLFTTWFFLTGVPKDLKSLDNIEDYPKELKIFSQYILFPLVLIYFIILYLYLGKIILAWDWPRGWVSRLILGFIATGLVSVLLVYPIRERIENRWMKIATKWFYVVIIPLTIMLFLAVWQRVAEYGITEGRYLGIATVVWLCVFTPYFIFSKNKKILFIPISLCVTVFIVSCGPWGVFAISEKNQVQRLKILLEKNHILVNGRVQNKHDSLQFEATRQISSILDYLSEVHGFDAIQPWFSESLKNKSAGTGNTIIESESIAKRMGVPFVRRWQASDDGTITLSIDREKALDIKGYNRLLRGQRVHSGVKNREFLDQGIIYQIGQDLSTLTVSVRHDTLPATSLQIDFKHHLANIIAEYGTESTNKIPPEKMSIVASNDDLSVKVFLSTIRIKKHVGSPEIVSYEAEIAYKIESDF